MGRKLSFKWKLLETLIVLTKPEMVSKPDANTPICVLTFITKNITKNPDSAVESLSI